MSDLILLAQSDAVQSVRDGYGNLIFMGLFFLGVIFAGIWWLRRG